MIADLELERDRIARIRERCRQVCDDMDKALDALDPARRAGSLDIRRRIAAENAAARELCRQAAEVGPGGVDPEKDWPNYIAPARAVLRAAAAA